MHFNFEEITEAVDAAYVFYALAFLRSVSPLIYHLCEESSENYDLSAGELVQGVDLGCIHCFVFFFPG